MQRTERQRRWLLFGFGVAALLIGSSREAVAQDSAGWGPGVYLTQAFDRIYTPLGILSEKTGYGLDESVAVLGAILGRGEKVWFKRPLRANVEYVFAAGGDDDALDVDLELSDSAGKLVARDRDTSSTAVLKYTPPRDGTFTLGVSLPLLEKGAGFAFCTVAILRQDGRPLLIEGVAHALVHVLRAGMVLSSKYKVDLLSEKNQWAIVGGVVLGEDELRINKMTFGTGARAIFAAADVENIDVDLLLRRAEDQVLVAVDDKDDAEACIVFQAEQGVDHSLIIRNASPRPRLILAAVLAIRSGTSR